MDNFGTIGNYNILTSSPLEHYPKEARSQTIKKTTTSSKKIFSPPSSTATFTTSPPIYTNPIASNSLATTSTETPTEGPIAEIVTQMNLLHQQCYHLNNELIKLPEKDTKSIKIYIEKEHIWNQLIDMQNNLKKIGINIEIPPLKNHEV